MLTYTETCTLEPIMYNALDIRLKIILYCLDTVGYYEIFYFLFIYLNITCTYSNNSSVLLKLFISYVFLFDFPFFKMYHRISRRLR